MPDGVPAVLGRLCELALTDPDVPDDGSGLDGVWTRTIPAADRDRDWKVALNGDTSAERETDGFPGDDDSVSVPPGKAVVHLGRMPAGLVGPGGGQIVFEQAEGGPQSLEDELLRDVETALLDAGVDIDRTVPETLATPVGGGD